MFKNFVSMKHETVVTICNQKTISTEQNIYKVLFIPMYALVFKLH